MTRQIGPQRNGIISKYLVAPTASDANFTTIAGAINAAVADGATANSPQIIYLKPGTYSESFSLPVGVQIAGLNVDLFTQNASSVNPVNITGKITINNAQGERVHIDNVTLSNTGANVIDLQGGILILSNVTASSEAGFSIINSTLTAPNNNGVVFNECSFTGNGDFISHTGAGVCTVSGYSTSFSNAETNTASAASGGFDIRIQNCDFAGCSFQIDSAASAAFWFCVIGQSSPATDFWNVAIAATGSVGFYGCMIDYTTQSLTNILNPAYTLQETLIVPEGIVSDNIQMNDGGAFRTSTVSTDTALLQAYNTNTASYTTFATLTANNPPTFDLNTATTIGGDPITHGTVTEHAIVIGDPSNAITSLGVATNGQIPIGSTGADPVLANITSTGGSVTITNGPGTINLETTNEGIQDIAGNSGTATGSTVTVSVAANNGTPRFTASGSTNSIAFTDSQGNTGIGSSSTLGNITTGTNNSVFGAAGAAQLTEGIQNVAVGTGTLRVTTGSNNVAIGRNAGNAYTSSESNNILLGTSTGVLGENNTLRIGNATGTGTGQLNSAFICGINGNTLGGTPLSVTIDPSTNQLGVVTLTNGDVTGPGSSTDNAIVRFDGTTGKVIQNSVGILSDTGALSGLTELTVDDIDLNGNTITALTASTDLNLTTTSTGNTVNSLRSMSVSQSLNGSAVNLSVSNLSNTASSDSRIISQAAGTSGGDPIYQSIVVGGQTWSFGTDNSDSDAFCLSADTSVGSTNVIHASTAGEINYPLQPAFLAYLASTDANVTGNGTIYTIGTNTAFTEVYDQGGDFNTNGTFTAPITGRYHIDTQATFTDLGATTNANIRVTTSNRTYFGQDVNPTTFGLSYNVSTDADMDAADTAVVQVRADGAGADTVDVLGGATQMRTRFSARLAC